MNLQLLKIVNILKNSWILDIGATDYVSYSTSHFTSFHMIKPIFVQLPNDSHVTTNFYGTAHFYEHLFLTNVLYIPDFNFNLIYVQCMIRLLNCTLTFSREHCQTQDIILWKTIGRANMQNDLNYLQASKNSSVIGFVNFEHNDDYQNIDIDIIDLVILLMMVY